MKQQKLKAASQPTASAVSKPTARFFSIITALAVTLFFAVGTVSAHDLDARKNKNTESISSEITGTDNTGTDSFSEKNESYPEDERYLIPIGKTVGVKLFSDGVMVVGVSDVSSSGIEVSPARDSGLEPGDIITHINSSEVENTQQLASIISDSEGEELSVRAMRGGREMEFDITPALSDEGYRLGAWIRDSIAGIGTVTYYDPSTNSFGALGHGVSDIDTSQLIPLSTGSVMHSSILSVKKGKNGAPGELRGSFDITTNMGTINKNTDFGIFGTTSDTSFEEYGEALPIAKGSEVENGPAIILSNVNGDEVQQFEIEIIKQFPSRTGTSRNMMIRVTDERLLAETGGIVQGMSGSPIIQNGKLIGAVTHVLIGDPTRGYGVYIENMLSAGETE